MKVLIIGSGGREHSIAWKLRQSKKVTQIFCAPGNPGTANIAHNVNLKVDQLAELKEFALNEKIDLTIVGPEYPLALGIVDLFESANLNIFGPNQKASKIEASKAYAKDIMIKAKVPTARFQKCTSKKEAQEYLKNNPAPIVLKADGLAAGKGVYVCQTQIQAETAIEELYQNQAAEVVIEEFLAGKEASFICAINQEQIVPLVAAHDYKRIFDKDQGPNTGGMGSVSPTPNLTQSQADWALENVIRPAINQLKIEGITFKGFLYAGLMISPDGRINVLEFNARLGDPETQVILSRLDSDLFDLIYQLTCDPKQVQAPIWSKDSAVCVVLAAGGYPQEPRFGDSILGIEFAQQVPNVSVFHAGTKKEDGIIYTAGGRVLNVVAIAETVEQARQQVYRAADFIQFRGRRMRRDI
jgi:phosphoribosylamine--glycine ligase